MAHAEYKIIIEKPVDEVYDFLIDGLNNPKWRLSVVRVALAHGEPGQVGAQYKQTVRGPGGRRIEGDYRITSADHGKQFSYRTVAGLLRPTGQFTFLEVDGGTEVTYVVNMEPSGLAQQMSGLIQQTTAEDVQYLDTLKEILEKVD